MMDRGQIIDKAKELTYGDRAEDYGEVNRNMQGIADFWNTYLESKAVGVGCMFPEDLKLNGEDVANMMVLLKMQRLCNVPGVFKADSYVDMAAYSGIAGECRSQTTMAVPSLDKEPQYDGNVKLGWVEPPGVDQPKMLVTNPGPSIIPIDGVAFTRQDADASQAVMDRNKKMSWAEFDAKRATAAGVAMKAEVARKAEVVKQAGRVL